MRSCARDGRHKPERGRASRECGRGTISGVQPSRRPLRCYLKARGGAATSGALTRRPHTCVRLQPSAPRMHAYTCQGSGATDADTTCCGTGASGRRCPRPNAGAKARGGTAVAGEGVTQTGAEAPSPEHLVGRGPHLLRRARHTHALSKAPNCIQESRRGRPMHYERMRLENEGNCWGAVTSTAPVLRRGGVQPLQPDCSPSHLHSAEACPVVRMPPCSGYHPMG